MGALQDALLNSGLAEERREPSKRKGRDAPSGSRPARRQSGGPSRPDGAPRGAVAKPGSAKPGTKQAPRAARPITDLERAYAARRKAEQAEKERVKQARVADQAARRERNLKLDRIVEGGVLNVEDAEIPRYFEHLGRIRRVLCTSGQREAINSGKLGIVNLRGRYLIVEPDVLERYRQVAGDLIPDLSPTEPESDAAGESGGDYPPVPDDLTW